MDPVLTEDGKPYGPQRYKEIVRERYEISKRINTSYNDLGEITPTERQYLLEFVLEDAEKTNKAIEESRQRMRTKN